MTNNIAPQARSFGIEAAALTDQGKIRENNEDAFSISQDIGLFVVSDGMGGHKAGEVVSGIVTRALPSQVEAALTQCDAPNEENLRKILIDSVAQLSNQVRQQTEREDALHGAGATVVACLIWNGVAIIAHMGDSRAYLLRDGVFERLTVDHSLGELLIEAGGLTRKQIKAHPDRNLVTRYVGMKESVGPEANLLDLQKGDRLLLCTDGLTNMAADRKVALVLSEEPDISRVCQELVDLANRAGGKDNITALIIDCVHDHSLLRPGKGKVTVRKRPGVSLRPKERDHEGVA